tara:strand:- start:588 stop:1217 length:630 start_codon:yes stop_codon:yes gene_type:complete
MIKDLITMFSMPPLGIFEYDGNLHDLKQFALTTEYGGSPNLQSVNTYILNDPKLKDLKQFCLDSIHQYSKEVVGISHPIELQQSWLNKCNSNVDINNHYHSNSFLSGVFYITSGSPISFLSDLSKTNYSIEATPDSSQQFLPSVIPSFSFPATPGILLIFSSNTNHFVHPNNSDQPRISLAFNTYPTLPYGNKQRLTVVGKTRNASSEK